MKAGNLPKEEFVKLIGTIHILTTYSYHCHLCGLSEKNGNKFSKETCCQSRHEKTEVNVNTCCLGSKQLLSYLSFGGGKHELLMVGQKNRTVNMIRGYNDKSR